MANNSQPVSTDKKCRFCLETATAQFPITSSIIKLVQSLTPIRINNHPIYNIMCVKCHTDLHLVKENLTKLVKVDDRFKTIIEKESIIAMKQENSSEDKQNIDQFSTSNNNNDNQKCRFCLEKPITQFPITSAIIQLVETLTSLRINDHPIYNVICVKCHTDLRLVQENLTKVVKADNKFKILIEKESPSVTEEQEANSLIEDHNIINDNNISVLKTSKMLIKEEIEIEEHSLILENLKTVESANNEVNFNNNPDELKKYWEETADSTNIKIPNIIKILNTKTNQTTYIHECEYCKKICKNKGELNQHLNSSHIRKECTICHKTVVAANIKNHMKTHERPPKPKPETNKIYECTICNKIYKTHRLLNQHNHNSHNRKECEICHKSVIVGAMKKHKKIHDNIVKPCKVCGEEVKEHRMNWHYERFHGDGNPCEICGKIFPLTRYLSEHIRSTHSKDNIKFICDKCGRSFKGRKFLIRHINRIHNKIYSYSCKICSKTFSTKFTLKGHERQHTNEKPFKCEICEEGFKHNVSLKNHKKTKHNIVEELSETCTICSKQFSSNGALKTHVAKMHPNKIKINK